MINACSHNPRPFWPGARLRYKTPMARAGHAAAVFIPALACLLLSACAGAGPPPGEPEPPAFARAFLAKGGETFVGDPARGLTWLGIISHELPFDQAELYCRELPPRPTASWRLPDVEELSAAPFGRYHLPDPPVRLWSASGPPGDTALRWVVDPYTRAREARPVRGDTHLRVLCVASAPPDLGP
jgi:hypothetical protein